MRVNKETRDNFAQLSAKTGLPMTELLQHAYDALQRKMFFDNFDKAYGQLRRDQEAWQETLNERQTEDGTLSDIED